jgi:DNA helicase-2/ATP-dependent DNA helicase PcrA
MLASNNFTEKQTEILKLEIDKHVVLAPPGSGKTQLLSQRVVDALSKGIDPETMLCITFTNRAAKNMNDRVGELGSKAPFIGTLHKFGYRFLLANQVIPASTALLDEEDAHQLLTEAVAAAKDDLNQRFAEVKLFDAANYIRDFNQALLNLRPTIEPSKRIEILEKIAIKYNSIKQGCSAIDFDDVLYLTLHSLRFGKPTKLCGFQWIQVDEVQDLSSMQWDILSRLVNDDSHVVYFGDYDQSIYSFMGASHESLSQCTQDVTEHYLEDNFRSPQYLIDFFNAYALANMPTRKVSELKFNSNNTNTGGKVRIHNASGVFIDEAYDISSKIIPRLIPDLKNIAILTRTNSDADIISQALKSKQIEHKKVSGFDLFRRKQIKDAMSFLNALANSQDRMAWTRLLSCFAGIGTLKASREMVNQIFSAGMTPSDWLVNENMQDTVDIFAQSFSSERCVIFDTETTGLSLQDDIIQIAAAEVVNGSPTGRTFEAYISTNKDVSDSSKIHHITQAVLDEKGIPPEEAYAKFLEFVDGAPLAGHNVISFDLPMLEANLSRINVKWTRPKKVFDTLTLAKLLHTQMKSYKLAHLIDTLKLEGQNTHNAIDDVFATVSLAVQLASEVQLHSSTRLDIKRQYSKFIQRFVLQLSPLWRKYQNAMDVSSNLGDVISDFFVYSQATIQYEIKNDEPEHIDTLVTYLREKTKSSPLSHHFKNLLRDLSTYSEADLITEDVKVVVSTIHKAKGLEFEGVVVTSCVENIFPHYYSKSSDAIDEDARLLYVGLTRAKKEIVITTHDTVENRGRSFPRYPSPFLQFLPRVPKVDQFAFD